MMPLQRARGAESRVRNKLSNGPLRVQSKAQVLCRVFCNVSAYVSCRGYACILISARYFREFKVAPRIYIYSSLTEVIFCQGRFLLDAMDRWHSLRATVERNERLRFAAAIPRSMSLFAKPRRFFAGLRTVRAAGSGSGDCLPPWQNSRKSNYL